MSLLFPSFFRVSLQLNSSLIPFSPITVFFIPSFPSFVLSRVRDLNFFLPTAIPCEIEQSLQAFTYCQTSVPDNNTPFTSPEVRHSGGGYLSGRRASRAQHQYLSIHRVRLCQTCATPRRGQKAKSALFTYIWIIIKYVD